MLDREVLAQVNRIYSITTFGRKHWKWIITALLLPVVAWLAKKLFE